MQQIDTVDYNITIYMSGYAIRQQGKLVDEVPRYWTPDGSMHEKTRNQLRYYLNDEDISRLDVYKNANTQSSNSTEVL